MERANSYFVFSRATVSGLRSVSLEDHVRHCLRAALLTRLGERCLRPELGSTVTDLLYRPLVPGLRLELENLLRQSLEQSEPRVEIDGIDIGSDDTDAARILVNLRYRIRETGKRDRVKVAL